MAETMNMVERVGRNIADADCGHFENYPEMYKAMARAAIEAMRPLPECLDKQGWALSRDFVREYPLALDAALSEGGE